MELLIESNRTRKLTSLPFRPVKRRTLLTYLNTQSTIKSLENDLEGQLTNTYYWEEAVEQVEVLYQRILLLTMGVGLKVSLS